MNVKKNKMFFLQVKDNEYFNGRELIKNNIDNEGNIGSGKTTLTKLLSKRYGWKPNFEPVDNNPYLADYYEDMKRWSFNLQIYFLNKRFHDVVEIAQNKETIIQDRTIFEDAKIFAPNLQ